VERALEGSAQVLQSSTCKSPLVSVVLPTFNRAAMLAESIESVLNQTERRLELIIVDDGSSDSTAEVIARYAEQDERITCVRQQNLRLPRALNNGFRLAHGEFFTWTSDDNRYLPDALAVMSGYLLENPEVGFTYAELLIRKPEGLVHLPFADPEDYWCQNTFGGAFMYRRSVAELAGEYDPELAMVEDYDYFLRLSYHTIVRHLPYVVYEHREHPGSLTNLGRREQYLALERMLGRHVRLRKAKCWQLSRLAATVARTSRMIGQPRDAARLAMLSWRLWPFNLRSYRALLLSLGRCIFPARKQP
jgi:glycosyltransferase involved in cell wall biosynthesis